jgi:F-type H+-transporting ATPase subunit a
MELEESIITKLVNGWLNHLLGYPEGYRLIPDNLVMTAFIVLLAAIFLPLIRRRFRLQHPGYLQQVLETVVEYLERVIDRYIGAEGRRYLPLLGTLGFFILLSSIIGYLPGLSSATANYNTTLALALISFIAYNYAGFKRQGLLHYFQNLGGKPLWLIPIRLPIEMVSHLARILSLSVRLFGNIYGDHLVVLVFFALFPVVLPIPFIGLSFFVAVIQTYVFVILTVIYLAGALNPEG